MPLAVNPCGHIWTKKLRKVLKSQKTPDFENPGFFWLLTKF